MRYSAVKFGARNAGQITEPLTDLILGLRRKPWILLLLVFLSAALSSVSTANLAAEPNRCESSSESYSKIVERAAPAIVSVQRTLRPKAARGEDLDPHEEEGSIPVRA